MCEEGKVHIRCPNCRGFYIIDQIFDITLPPANRTLANLWKAKFFEMHSEVVKANKGIKRLKRQIERTRSFSCIKE